MSQIVIPASRPAPSAVNKGNVATSQTASRGGRDRFTPETSLTIGGTNFLINNVPINQGFSAVNLMTCVRAAQGIFDDENTVTQKYWNYPASATGPKQNWNNGGAMRNTIELCNQLPVWRASGVRCVAITMQGGQPWKGYPGLDGFGAGTQPWIVSAFNHDGTLRNEWMGRLQKLIEAADDANVIVNIAMFYQAQIAYLNSPDTNTAINVAIDALVDWLAARGYTNVLLEIANECDQTNFNSTNIAPASVPTLISRAQTRAASKNYRLYVTVSFNALVTPTAAVVSQADYILLHGNIPMTTTQCTSLINSTTALAQYQANPKPIYFNEGSRGSGGNGPGHAVMDAALGDAAGWGFHYLYEGNEGIGGQGQGDYRDAIQSVPINWSTSGPSGVKDDFFARALVVAGP